MTDTLKFENRSEFRRWLSENCQLNDGIWLIFEKNGKTNTLKANEALEEALCFGWIDGQLQRLDDKTYKKYFSMRRVNSKWSEKNKNLAMQLEERGLMTDYGRNKIREAQANGQWNASKTLVIKEEQITYVASLLQGYEPAYTNFLEFSRSIKKTYTRAYLDAKTEAGRERRLSWIIDRCNKNLKPM
ncbi:MAG: YdeI/OmpD-associated family protein [Anaeroplasmataceae bacterium]|nr:YdeI/OmpD-associated family protein [Anaeroplasmataceae bacterium]